MARLPRLTIPGQVHHILLNAATGRQIVRDSSDGETFRECLDEAMRREGVQLNAYCVVPSQVRLMLTPDSDIALSRVMQDLGRRYVRRFNHRHAESGSPWEGRFRSTIVEMGKPLLECMVANDLLPVNLGLCQQPQEHLNSSYRAYAGLTQDRTLSPPQAYWGLGNTPFAREAAYAEMVREGNGQRTAKVIEDAVLHGWPYGTPAFLEHLQELTDRRLTRLKPGRPRTVSGSA